MNPPPRDPGTSAPTPTASDGRDAYAIAAWMLALGAVIVGILAFQEPVTVPRLIFVGLLLVGIVGLKLTA